MDQSRTPLYDTLHTFKKRHMASFHVPGHKHGKIFPDHARADFQSILGIDMTEITGLDDLHAPEEIIKDAQELAAGFFKSRSTYFLINGSTSGNLAMLMSVCMEDKKVLVQRNCHKSVMHGLELSGAKPVFLGPGFEEITQRYSKMDPALIEEAITIHPDVSALVLTYPDYFGRAYDIKKIISIAHARDIPVLVDEAHGVHFHLGSPFPSPAMEAGADVVVQSAHKMAPAMTMASYLHVGTTRINQQSLEHYLQVFQSSSPSYPLMASLDLARYFLAGFSNGDMQETLRQVKEIRKCLSVEEGWQLQEATPLDDPLKITLHIDEGWSGFQLAKLFEEEGVYPELASANQLLFVLGLGSYVDLTAFNSIVERVNDRLKNIKKHATMKKVSIQTESILELAYSYHDMKGKKAIFKAYDEVEGEVAAQAVIPYPPGIPILLKGEKITSCHISHIKELQTLGSRFHNPEINQGLYIY
ncbi:aminotransferase class I/II-fold pyridoxal phosphate-dependent enzyme [Thalassobacillus pellis]|uniref:aminotransferase class I/II-fold pyridoxal phosphate-dependent enzyme n=1 Tax=Thalassobacillus pellis TaxID=748008 RepID=UPI00195FDE0E|nr:aminotransferase class I/II-fold pyridoxal phosphate-dependent enzyme [Thalassobacillus pellis]MBM7555156.1 lysine decarboxylase [Thalassobacillus pellis]